MPAEQLTPVEIAFAAKLDAISGALNQLGKQFEDFSKNAGAKFGALGGSIDSVIGKVKTLVAGFLSIEGIRRAINATTEMTVAQEKLAKQMGITGAEASVMDVALGDIHSSTQEYAQASQFLVRQLKTNEERLESLGLKLRDSNGNYKDQKTLMLEAIGVVNSYKQGIDRGAASTEFFGRSANQLQDLLKLNNEVLEAARRKAEDLGLVMTAQGKKGVDEYRSAMNDLGDVSKGITKVIGEGLMPVITSFANWIAGAGKEIVEGFRLTVTGLAIAFHVVSGAVRTTVEIIVAGVQVITVAFITLADAQQKALRFDFKGAITTLNTAGTQVVDILRRTRDRVKEIGGETGRAIFEAMNPDQSPAGRQGVQGARGFTPEKKGTMGELETKLAMMKASFAAQEAEEGRFRRFSLEQERTYWAQVLETAELTKDEYQQVLKKMYELDAQMAKEGFDESISALKTEQEEFAKNAQERLRVAVEIERRIIEAYGAGSKEAEAARRESVQAERELRDQQRQMDELLFERRQQLRLSEISLDREQIRQERELGVISGAEAIERQRELAQREYEIKRQVLLDKIALETEDRARRERMLSELEALDQQHGLTLAQNTNDRLIEIRNKWEEVLGAISSAFSTSIKGMILGTTTLREAMRNMGTAILGEFVSWTVKMAVRWVATEVAKTQATAVGASARVATEESAGLASMAINAGVAIVNIMNAAWETFGNVYKSVSAIPYVGWILAPIMAGAAMALVAGMAKKVVSAEGGAWRLAEDSLMLAHKEEMVLPRQHAESLRQLVEGGGTMGGNFNFTIMAVDAKSVRRLFKNEGGALVDSLRGQMRDFKR